MIDYADHQPLYQTSVLTMLITAVSHSVDKKRLTKKN